MQDARLGLSLAKGGAAALLTRPPPQARATFLAFVGLSTAQSSRVLRMSALTDLMVTFSLLQGHEQQIVQCGCGHACDGIAEMSYIHIQKMKLRCPSNDDEKLRLQIPVWATAVPVRSLCAGRRGRAADAAAAAGPCGCATHALYYIRSLWPGVISETPSFQ